MIRTSYRPLHIFSKLLILQNIVVVVVNICDYNEARARARAHTHTHIQGVSRLEDITAAGDFLGLSDQKSSYKHVSDFGRLRSYDRLKLRIEGNDY